MKIHVIATYLNGSQQIFTIDDLQDDVSEIQMLHQIFEKLSQPQNLEVLSVAEIRNNIFYMITFGREGKWYFNPDWNVDDQTIEDRIVLNTWLETRSGMMSRIWNFISIVWNKSWF